MTPARGSPCGVVPPYISLPETYRIASGKVKTNTAAEAAFRRIWSGFGGGPTDRGTMVAMKQEVSHDWSEETPEAKARWFQSLSYEERMTVLCAFTDLAFALNPHIADPKDAQQTRPGIQIIERP